MAFLLVEEKGGPKQRVEVDAPSFVVGKRAGNGLVLNRPNISREHCVILQSNGNFVLRDLGSRNGTYIDGVRITADVALRDGSSIQLGDFTLAFHREHPTPAEEAQAPAAESQAAHAPPTADNTPAVKAQPPARRETARPGTIPVELKRRLHDQILERLDLKHSDLLQQSTKERWTAAAEAARASLSEIADDIPPWLPPEQLIKEVVDEAVALGPLEDLLADPEVDEIMVNGPEHIYVERHGRIVPSNKQFTGSEQVLAVIRRILAPIGRRIDESSPMVDARLPDGSRVHAIIPPVCLTGPTITIRKFAATPFTAQDLINFGSLTRSCVDFLRICVEARKNILISGGTGTGKTTLLNVVSSFIPSTERIVTIEDAAELKLHQEHIVSLEAKPPNIEGKGDIPIRKLVINSLRMRPDRIVVGECRGGEALDMLQAMNTGHDGSLTTVHANSVRDSLSRLETMVLMSGMELPSRAIRDQISSAIHIIVQLSRLSDGSRKVVTVSEMCGMEGDTFVLQEIFHFKQTGIGPDGKVLGEFVASGSVPRFVQGLRERGIDVDLALFRPPAAKT